MLCQAERRLSRGWVDWSSAGYPFWAGAVGCVADLNVSWIPGAEGAPFEVLAVEEVLVVEVEWDDEGTNRRDCRGWVSSCRWWSGENTDHGNLQKDIVWEMMRSG